MRNVVSWGTYMTNFVFFIGISHAGTLISAILRVTDAGWRRPITRMAEAITCIALLVGASMVVIDMGRPDRVHEPAPARPVPVADPVGPRVGHDIPHGQLLLPVRGDDPGHADLLAKYARERGRSPWLVRLYEILSLGYRESPEHRRLLARALGAMAVIIIPVAVSVHTVVSWVFGMTLRPGWHSTIFGPYFVIGAIFSGTAALITAMVIFRKAYHLEEYLRPEHFHKLSKILLALSLLYGYFTLSEYLTTWYGGDAIDVRLLALLAGNGTVGAVFWLWATFGLFVPIALLLFPSKRSLTADHDRVDPDQHRHVGQALPDHRSDARDAVHSGPGRRDHAALLPEPDRDHDHRWRVRRLRAALHPLLAHLPDPLDLGDGRGPRGDRARAGCAPRSGCPAGPSRPRCRC